MSTLIQGIVIEKAGGNSESGFKNLNIQFIKISAFGFIGFIGNQNEIKQLQKVTEGIPLVKFLKWPYFLFQVKT